MFEVGDDGSMSVVETIVVDVSTFDRHGIFRFFDRADPNAPAPAPRAARHRGAAGRAAGAGGVPDPGPGAVLRRQDRRPGPRRWRSGEHTYRIEYVVDDVLIEDPDGDGSRFYWQIIPGGWAQQIERGPAQRPPARRRPPTCSVPSAPPRPSGAGRRGRAPPTSASPSPICPPSLRSPCRPTSTSRCRPRWETATPGRRGTTRCWHRSRWWCSSCWAGLLAAAVGARASRRAHETTPPFPLQYAPPPGVGPAQAAYILDERVGREQFVATVLHAAEQGVVTVEHAERDWTLRESGEKSWQDVDAVTGGLAHPGRWRRARLHRQPGQRRGGQEAAAAARAVRGGDRASGRCARG